MRPAVALTSIHHHLCAEPSGGPRLTPSPSLCLSPLCEPRPFQLETTGKQAESYYGEVRDLKHQVTMLTGREPGDAGELSLYESQYTELTRDSVSLVRSLAPKPTFPSSQRIQHQRINPELIIKEKDIIIEKIVGESAVESSPLRMRLGVKLEAVCPGGDMTERRGEGGMRTGRRHRLVMSGTPDACRGPDMALPACVWGWSSCTWLGVGCFGKVWKGQYNNHAVAIKCFYSSDSDVIAEINLMERVNGKPHVLPLEGVYLSSDTGEEAQVALVTPYMVNGSLYDVMVNTKAPQYRYEER